jgi:N-acyl-L-homoserine lactone synthetase
VGVRIRLARTTEELDTLFRRRHEVFVEELQLMRPTPDGRMADRFDAFPTSTNIIALVDSEIVAGARFMVETSAGMPAQQSFDFGPHLPPGSRVGSGGMLWVDRAYRGLPRLTFSMMGMGFQWAHENELTHLVGMINPRASEGFEQAGFELVGEAFPHGPDRVWALPVVLAMANLDPRFVDFVERQDIRHFFEGYERQFQSAGEVIFRQGDEAHDAYVVVDGEVEVQVTHGDRTATLATVKEGEVFGELALLVDTPRSATVRAVTDVDLMVLGREAFQSQLQSNPAIARRLLGILGRRLAAQNRLMSTTPRSS